MKVLGIGLPRTGNTSLAAFLSTHLGYRVSQYGVAKACYRECEAMVDFPIPIMFPWLMATDQTVRAILTLRDDLGELHRSITGFITHMVENSSSERIREMLNVTRILFGREFPELRDIIAASDRLERAAAPFVKEGRVLRLPLHCEDKAAAVCGFLGVPDTGTTYPHEGVLIS